MAVIAFSVFMKATIATTESLSLLSYYFYYKRQAATNSKFIQMNSGNKSCSQPLKVVLSDNQTKHIADNISINKHCLSYIMYNDDRHYF